MITIVFMYAVLAISFTISKLAIQHATPYFLIGFRMITAGTLFLTFQYIFNRKNFVLRKSDIGSFLYVSLFYIYLAFIPEFWALQKLSSSKVVIIYSATPFIAAALAYFLAKERLTIKKIIGMLIGLAGIFPILMTQNLAGPAKEFFYISSREAILLIAVVSAAYAWFPLKKLMNKGYTLPMINGTTMLIGGIGAMLTSFAVEGVVGTHVYSVGPFLLWTLLLVFLSNGIFYSMYGWHLRRYSFTLLSFAGFLCPVFGAFFGWYLLSEPITWHHFLSLFLISIGLYLFYQEELKK
jgi:drug/metabolite transporter (DMT)-like permease